jgi:hypothetical protein
MKRITALAIGLLLLVGSIAAYAETPASYQVTGPITKLTNDMITIEKDGKPWEIARDASTKVPADVKVGTKYTVYYRMTATTVELPKASSKVTKATTTTKKP